MKFSIFPLLLSLTFATQASPGPDSLTSLTPAKSEVVAYSLATLGTIAPILLGIVVGRTDPEVGMVLFIGGITPGASLGQYYAESFLEGNLTLAVRVLGLGLVRAAFVSASNDRWDFAISYGLAGGVLFDVSVIYSLIDTHFAVKRANERARAKQSTTSFDIFPTLSRTAKGGLGAGMMARVGF